MKLYMTADDIKDVVKRSDDWGVPCRCRVDLEDIVWLTRLLMRYERDAATLAEDAERVELMQAGYKAAEMLFDGIEDYDGNALCKAHIWD